MRTVPLLFGQWSRRTIRLSHKRLASHFTVKPCDRTPNTHPFATTYFGGGQLIGVPQAAIRDRPPQRAHQGMQYLPHMAKLADFMCYQVHAAIPAVAAHA